MVCMNYIYRIQGCAKKFVSMAVYEYELCKGDFLLCNAFSS